MKRLFVILALALLVTACSQTGKEVDNGLVAEYDVIQDDVVMIFSEENITSYDISVDGVMLNDSRRDVLNELGSPDNFTRFEGDGLVIENLEYGERLGLNKTGLIVHLENDVVTRITVNENYNKFLTGETLVGDEKADIYFLLGSADNTEIVYRYILLQYADEGIEFIMFRGDEVGFSLVPPGEVSRNISTEIGEQVYIPYSGEIVFD